MKQMKIVIIAILALTMGGTCLADIEPDPTKENAELKARIEKLEKELTRTSFIYKF